MIFLKCAILFFIILGFAKLLNSLMRDLTIKGVTVKGELKADDEPEVKIAIFIIRVILALMVLLMFSGAVFILELIEFVPLI